MHRGCIRQLCGVSYPKISVLQFCSPFVQGQGRGRAVRGSLYENRTIHQIHNLGSKVLMMLSISKLLNNLKLNFVILCKVLVLNIHLNLFKVLLVWALNTKITQVLTTYLVLNLFEILC